MHADTPPLIAPPAIVRPGESWERQLRFELAAKGVPIGAVIAIVAEVKRLQDTTGLIRRPALADVSKWAKFNVAMLPGLAPWVVSSGGPTLRYISSNQYATTGSHSGVAIGSPAAGDLLVFGITGMGNGANNQTLSSATIGGVALTIHAQGAAASAQAAICSVVVSGALIGASTATLVLTWSGTYRNDGWNSYLLKNLVSTTPYNSNAASFDNKTNDTANTTVNVANRGILIACCGGATASASTTWTGATEDHDAMSSDLLLNTSASASGLSSATGLAVSAVMTGVDERAIAVATWR